MTFRAGGGMVLPGMVICLPGSGCGGCGGASRTTSGAGAGATGPGCLTMSGGAGATCLLANCLMMMSPALGGGGGFKYRTAISCK